MAHKMSKAALREKDMGNGINREAEFEWYIYDTLKNFEIVSPGVLFDALCARSNEYNFRNYFTTREAITRVSKYLDYTSRIGDTFHIVGTPIFCKTKAIANELVSEDDELLIKLANRVGFCTLSECLDFLIDYSISCKAFSDYRHSIIARTIAAYLGEEFKVRTSDVTLLLSSLTVAGILKRKDFVNREEMSLCTGFEIVDNP